MINFKTGYSKKEKFTISSLLMDLTDVFGDFYITRDNLRLFIKDNIDILFDCIKKGDKYAYDESGIALVLGYSDNAKRKYLKALAKEPKDIEKYIKIILWNINEDLYCKVKRNNPVKGILLNLGFEFKGGRGSEVLLWKKYNKKDKGDK